jgi:tetratricopeptide (TPR) repeat protein
MKFQRKIPYLIFCLILTGCASTIQLQEYDSALKAYNEGKYQTAITFIDRALEIKNDEPDFYILRAKANYKIDNKNLAMNDLNKSLELKNNFNAHYLRGKIFLEFDELEKAKQDFREAYNLNPESSDLLFDLGYLEFLNGENQLALEYYLNAAKYDSRNSKTYVNIGNLYAMMGNSKLAVDNYSKALVLDTTDGIAYYNRANEKMLLGNFAGAIEDYENSLLIDSLNINTHFDLAEAKIRVNNSVGALNNYNSILKIDSTSGKAYYLRGKVEVLLEEFSNACLDFKQAGELGYFDAYEMIKKYCDPKKRVRTPKNKKK